MSVTIPDINISADFNIKDITNDTKTGVFDVLVSAQSTIMETEYNNNRLRGTDYSNVLANSMSNTLSQAVGYSLQKAKLPLELQLLDAEKAKIAADTVVATKQGALIDTQNTKEQAARAQVIYETQHILPKQAAEITARIAATDAQTAQTKEVTTHHIPLQTELLNKQVAGAQLDNDTKQYTLDIMLPAQLAQTQAQTAGILLDNDTKQYTLDTLLPAQLEQTLKQNELLEQQVALATYELTYLKPKELALKEQQLLMAERELELKAKELAIQEYMLANKLPADIALVNAQTDLYTRKATTESAQTDGTVAGEGSVIDLQNKLLVGQAKAFDHDMRLKTAKIMIDTWTVRRNLDPDDPASVISDENQLTNQNIGNAIKSVFSSLDIETP